jgi:prolyl oligopeptidase
MLASPKVPNRERCRRGIPPCGTLGLIVLFTTLFVLQSVRAQSPPISRTDSVKEIIQGVEITDPYRWLEDQNSPETRAWIRAQNEYTAALLGKVPGREWLRDEAERLIRVESLESPLHRNGRYFFSKRNADQDLDVIYMRNGLDGQDVALIDPHSLSEDHMLSVVILGISSDGRLLAYGVRRGGEDEVTPVLFDVDRRAGLDDRFSRGRYSDFNIRPGNREIYYTLYGEAGERVYRHRLGTDASEDVLIFGEGYGPGMGIGLDMSDDGRFLLFSVYHGSAARKSELYYTDLETGGEVRTIVNDVDASFEGGFGGKTLFIQTDWQAPNGRILAADLDNPGKEAWHDIIPEGSAVINSFQTAGGRLMVRYDEHVIPLIRIYEPDGRYLAEIEPPAIGYLGQPKGRWTDGEAFFYFSSFYIPDTIYRYDLEDLSLTVWEQADQPLDGDDYELRQVWYESADGTRIPMFIANRKGIRYDGSNPTLLTGYGGFRSIITPHFSPKAAAWVKIGGVYAVANLRGGGEFGEDWHRAGMLDKKQNTFDDFIAAAEWLIDNGYTRPDKLAITGGSNGGLLVGAALTQRPDLFRAVICTYPLLDMVRYHKFLVARFWVPEYGSSEDPEQFKYIYAYSPYHRVRAGVDYPAVLLVTGDSDTRVDPLHARKMAALLQASTGSDRPVLLHYDTTAGHSVGRPVSMLVDDLTDQLAFLVWQLDIAL